MILTKKNTPSQLHPWLTEINELYYLYVDVMDLKRRRSELDNIELIKAWLFVGYAYLLDVKFNVFTATKIFNDRPREFTFTARLVRYRKGSDRVKMGIAEFLCDSILDQADPDGNHC